MGSWGLQTSASVECFRMQPYNPSWANLAAHWSWEVTPTEVLLFSSPQLWHTPVIGEPNLFSNLVAFLWQPLQEKYQRNEIPWNVLSMLYISQWYFWSFCLTWEVGTLMIQQNCAGWINKKHIKKKNRGFLLIELYWIQLGLKWVPEQVERYSTIPGEWEKSRKYCCKTRIPLSHPGTALPGR